LTRKEIVVDLFRPDAAECRVREALVAIAQGRPVVVVDDADRENEGDLIFAAELATPELVSFMVRYTSGYICVALTEQDCDRLDLPPMYHTNSDNFRTAFTVTVDAKHGVSTGISSTDRAHTIRLLATAASSAADFNRPGHVVPLRAKPGGVLRRRRYAGPVDQVSPCSGAGLCGRMRHCSRQFLLA
jgi:3,4-dihydroxy 2-butanone 4-phosphate synthase/GTP cyclohydrolase II